MILVSPGDSRNWIIYAKNKTSNHPNGLPDVLLIVASDQIELLDKKIEFLKEKTEDYELISNYLEYGHDLSFFGDESRRGNEHFRFKYNYISEKRLIRGNISNQSICLSIHFSRQIYSNGHHPIFSCRYNMILIFGNENYISIL